MILVTGASGQFGKATIQFLIEKGINPSNIIGLVRNESLANNLKAQEIQIAVGDYENYASLVKAFAGVEKLVFVSGSDIANRSFQHENVVKAAIEVGVKHIVYTSFQRKNETETSPLWMVAKSHLVTEHLIKASGINYTILKNNLYMDFVPAFVGEHVLKTGIIYLPAGNGSVSAVLRSELAEATANIITTGNHDRKVYDFTNSEGFTYEDVASHISKITHKNIKYISPTSSEYAEALASYGVPSDVIGLFSSFAIAQAAGELDLEADTLEHILGRKPTSIGAFLTQVFS